MYLVYKVVSFPVPDSKIIQHLYDINAGSTFGELALIRNMVRNFTVICKGNYLSSSHFLLKVYTQRLNQNDLPIPECWYYIMKLSLYIQATRNFLAWARMSLTRYWERITKIPGTNGWISFKSQSTLKSCQMTKSGRWRICQKSENIPITGYTDLQTNFILFHNIVHYHT